MNMHVYKHRPFKSQTQSLNMPTSGTTLKHPTHDFKGIQPLKARLRRGNFGFVNDCSSVMLPPTEVAVGDFASRRPVASPGKANVLGKVTGTCTLGAAGVEVAAAAKAGISERSARRIEHSEALPSQRDKRTWRTRKDPLTPVTRVQALARGVLAFAWHRHPPANQPFEVPPAKTIPRRLLSQDELARIDELTQMIGPAFDAAMKKSEEKGDKGPAISQDLRRESL